MLKGKAKIDFEQWCVENVTMNDTIRTIIDYDNLLYYPETMQQGVLREFFESKGIIMCSYKPRNESEYAFTLYDINSDWSAFVKAPDYSTAFTHAIDKVCKIYGGEG